MSPERYIVIEKIEGKNEIKIVDVSGEGVETVIGPFPDDVASVEAVLDRIHAQHVWTVFRGFSDVDEPEKKGTE